MSTLEEKEKEKSNQWWRNNKMDMSVFFLLLFLPRGPRLRSDTWLSNSMNSGESSSVASVRDYQRIHAHTHQHTNNATTSHALTATVPQDSQVGRIWVSEVWYYYFVPIYLIFFTLLFSYMVRSLITFIITLLSGFKKSTENTCFTTQCFLNLGFKGIFYNHKPCVYIFWVCKWFRLAKNTDIFLVNVLN